MPMENVSENDVFIVETTVDNASNAEVITKNLLDKKLAACIQISQVKSFFVWEGVTDRVEEYKISIKTLGRFCKGVVEGVKDLHIYKVPEIIIVKAEYVDPKYMDWVNSLLCKST